MEDTRDITENFGFERMTGVNAANDMHTDAEFRTYADPSGNDMQVDQSAEELRQQWDDLESDFGLEQHDREVANMIQRAKQIDTRYSQLFNGKNH